MTATISETNIKVCQLVIIPLVGLVLVGTLGLAVPTQCIRTFSLNEFGGNHCRLKVYDRFITDTSNYFKSLTRKPTNLPFYVI